MKRPESQTAAPEATFRSSVVEALKSIYDPEIPVDIYELGLIYDVDISDDGDATITMTLTTPHCPVAELLPNEVELRVAIRAGHPRRRREFGMGSAVGSVEDERRSTARIGNAVNKETKFRARALRPLP